MSEPTIRPAGIDDVPAIRTVANASWHATYDEAMGEASVDDVLADWYAPETLRAQVSDDDSVFLVAEVASDIVGYANAGPDPDRDSVHQLWRLYVRPDRFGQGIGSALLSAAERDLRGSRETLELTVLASNDRARGFYESKGFELVDRRPTTHAGTSIVECVYRKPLGRRQG